MFQVLNDQTFAILVLMALVTTFMTTPIVIAVYKPAKKLAKAGYKHRTIQRNATSSQLRILACFHSSRDIPTLINLIEASRGIGKKEKLRVYAMHLMELSERSSAMLMVHKARRNGLPFWNSTQNSNSNHIVFAFEAFQQLSRVSIRPTTAISPMSNMHEDICSSADSKGVAMIILPFHKHQRLDGQLETTRADIRHVNRKVLEHAPCSVGLLIDRGLGGPTHIAASDVNSVMTVLFFGGHDDHEALAYGAWMAEHPGITLIIVRFVLQPKVLGEVVSINMDDIPNAEESNFDEEILEPYKNNVSTNSSITYEETVVSNAAETIEAIRKYNRSNLFLVGRTPDGELAAALKTKCECPELGPTGSLLTSPTFSTTASVLVVQHYHSKLSTHSLASLKEEGDVEDIHKGDSDSD